MRYEVRIEKGRKLEDEREGKWGRGENGPEGKYCSTNYILYKFAKCLSVCLCVCDVL